MCSLANIWVVYVGTGTKCSVSHFKIKLTNFIIKSSTKYWQCMHSKIFSWTQFFSYFIILLYYTIYFTLLIAVRHPQLSQPKIGLCTWASACTLNNIGCGLTRIAQQLWVVVKFNLPTVILFISCKPFTTHTSSHVSTHKEIWCFSFYKAFTLHVSIHISTHYRYFESHTWGACVCYGGVNLKNCTDC